ncbi:MAG: hypothetical protein PHH37_11485 [Paludibacter sp.]|nr:hypothetical protein [Paludibacter sp.]
METKYENGGTRYFDYEVEKAFKQEKYGVPIADFFRYEAKAHRYGKIGYLGKLKEELKHFEEEFLEINEIHDRDCMEILRKAILDLQDLNIQAPAKQLETNLTPEQRRKAIDEPKIYKHIPKNENHLHDYLYEIRTSFDLTKKNTFGAVCLALHENKIFNPTVKFNELVDKLAIYWNIEPLKDKRPSHYRNEMNKLISKYGILERKKI